MEEKKILEQLKLQQEQLNSIEANIASIKKTILIQRWISIFKAIIFIAPFIGIYVYSSEITDFFIDRFNQYTFSYNNSSEQNIKGVPQAFNLDELRQLLKE